MLPWNIPNKKYETFNRLKIMTDIYIKKKVPHSNLTSSPPSSQFFFLSQICSCKIHFVLLSQENDPLGQEPENKQNKY